LLDIFVNKQNGKDILGFVLVKKMGCGQIKIAFFKKQPCASI
jgi:hypothetical protein